MKFKFVSVINHQLLYFYRNRSCLCILKLTISLIPDIFVDRHNANSVDVKENF